MLDGIHVGWNLYWLTCLQVFTLMLVLYSTLSDIYDLVELSEGSL